jgi:Na+-translocating ferredoxin:NAD+ oxidoreductase subunit G
MVKLESSFKNMLLSLTLISIGMSAALGFVYNLTKGPIEIAQKQKEVQALREVLPEFDNDPVESVKSVDGLFYYTAAKEGEVVGYAVNTFTEKGFSGKFTLMVGFKPDGTINNISVLEQKETPGLGNKMKEPKFKDQFPDKNPGQFKLKVKKDGGQVDAITAATISSRAFCDAVQRAYDGYLVNCKQDIAPAIMDTISTDTTGIKKTKGGNK